jgi:uncharacterized damage-inducible protein DinB
MTQQPAYGSEKDLLVAKLDAQREHVLGALEGLTDEQLRQPVLPTGWSCLGLVQHLTQDVELLWFAQVFAGRSAEHDGAGWKVGEDTTAEDVLARYRAAVSQANEIIAGHGLTDAPAAWPEGMFGEWRLHDLRQMMLHVLTETACHAGHLDAVRELLDGQTWLILT